MSKADKLLVNSCDCHGTDKKPISRKDFREICLIRDGHKCLFCDEIFNDRELFDKHSCNSAS